MKLIVGLGNPGAQYDNTRHNVGFMLVDDMARDAGTSLSQNKFQGLFTKSVWNGYEVGLLKPLTYMNRSGPSVLEAMQFYKLGVEDVIVIFDDLDQEHGAVRMRHGGGHGGHNGIRSILQSLGAKDKFYRMKVGIGKPEHRGQTSSWVLGAFTNDEMLTLEQDSFPEVKTRIEKLLKQLNK